MHMPSVCEMYGGFAIRSYFTPRLVLAVSYECVNFDRIATKTWRW